ncbi:MAG: acetate kinase, partial [Candidatus Omnitrophica bacterium]|nr:acetate kinase [Candidatus Omnitrophota bacterium]
TRCGDIDVASVFYIIEKEKLAISEMDQILNKQSGLLGVSGLSNDFRLIRKAMAKGSQRAKLAYEIFIHRIKKYIGAYLFILKGADAVCFTGGIGENTPKLIEDFRQSTLRFLGSKTKILVIPTDEELMIAHLACGLINKPQNKKRKIK